jgi:hypothetical protein
MEVPQDVINKWQAVWQQICDMAYHNKNIVGHVYASSKVLGDIDQYKNASNFELITLDHSWTVVSQCKDENGKFLQARVVPELQEIYVPRKLFEAMGVYTWFQYSFPNCVILFWEDMQ